MHDVTINTLLHFVSFLLCYFGGLLFWHRLWLSFVYILKRCLFSLGVHIHGYESGVAETNYDCMIGHDVRISCKNYSFHSSFLKVGEGGVTKIGLGVDQSLFYHWVVL